MTVVQIATAFDGVALVVSADGTLYEDEIPVSTTCDCGICAHLSTRPALGMATARHAAQVRSNSRYKKTTMGIAPWPVLAWATYPDGAR